MFIAELWPEWTNADVALFCSFSKFAFQMSQVAEVFARSNVKVRGGFVVGKKPQANFEMNPVARVSP